ncbi:bifunctional glutamate N-acetyltransferase/amino-acid acetyltransferase ArgJ [Aquella oligotrophica]|uniref:Arginine biosynthesis bifunctional protein ArgJ n=1 Tax=Aquella oligotrophica TaxID=2067065 RepID=A0A2I7N482_9NEIS|nr:bifunctional glutamate N-acetyltransferase/amino-acid acetyltransferase ArgJ [Aquella oligotrophica]AUR51272.1 hypothetical protein CUN60_02805 [Aquella oligotrophica]
MNKKPQWIEKNICAPQGFKASGISAGLKKSQKPDLALIYSEVPAIAAGVFTKNKVKAAPLLATKKNLKNGQLQAIIINSGNANACTGKNGVNHVKQTIATLSDELAISPSLIGVASTGVIGVPLAIDTLIEGIPKLTKSLDNKTGNPAATAILTTDTFIKEAAIKVKLSNETIIKLGGIAKGSGMIHPNMATMLAFVTTDALITAEALQAALSLATENSFNMISVDGDSSTNDMLVAMANGLAKNNPIDNLQSIDGQIFYHALLELCINLAKQIAKDGEGASKLITVNVSGAKTSKQAKSVAKAVVSSSLVKAAVFGNDANWGRIACAVGYSDTQVKADKLEIAIENLLLFSAGVPLDFCEDTATKLLKQAEVKINIDLGLGKEKSTSWGCDLTYDYVKINAAYRT